MMKCEYLRDRNVITLLRAAAMRHGYDASMKCTSYPYRVLQKWSQGGIQYLTSQPSAMATSSFA